MKITIEFIPHREQRYNTVGDWVFSPEGDLNIKVSQLEDTRQAGEFLIAIHELIEALLCYEHGVSTTDVDRFDIAHQGEADESGDLPDAPYYMEHQLASGIERIIAADFGVDWLSYEAELEELTDIYEENKHERSSN